MNLLKQIQEFAAFTKNEQKVFLFLALVFLAGVSIRVYKTYFVATPVRQFDYSASDKEFRERSISAGADSSRVESRTGSEAADSTGGKKKVNVNTASKKELVSLPGIGEGIAEALMIYRDEHGRFASVEELKKVKGIGPKKFEKLRPYVDIK